MTDEEFKEREWEELGHEFPEDHDHIVEYLKEKRVLLKPIPEKEPGKCIERDINPEYMDFTRETQEAISVFLGEKKCILMETKLLSFL